MTKTWTLLALALLFLLPGAAHANDLTQIKGCWKIPGEFPGRVTYYFNITMVKNKEGKIVGSRSKLTYPDDSEMEGTVPHQDATFVMEPWKGTFILAPMIHPPQVDEKT